MKRYLLRFSSILLVLLVLGLHLGGFLLQEKLPPHVIWLVWLILTPVDAAIAFFFGRTARKLQYLETNDVLTRLYNRASFYEKLKDELARAKKKKSELSLILLDIDEFAGINDTYGHVSGDEVLQRIAQITLAHTGKSGIAARLSGDEFGILLPKVALDKAADTAEAIRLAVEKEEFRYDDGSRHYSVSAGAVAACEGETEDSFTRLAYMALSKAKEGKNQVVSL